jgi:hypothetical protein
MRLIHFPFGGLHTVSGGACSFPEWGPDWRHDCKGDGPSSCQTLPASLLLSWGRDGARPRCQAPRAVFAQHSDWDSHYFRDRYTSAWPGRLITRHHGDWWAVSGGIFDLDLTGRSVGLQRAATLKDEFDKTASHNEHHLSQIRRALS